MIPLTGLKDSELEVIVNMNRVLLSGRKIKREWTPDQSRFAAKYFLRIIGGVYFDVEKNKVDRLGRDYSKDVIVGDSIVAFVDFTSSNQDFLYHKDENISDADIKRIGRKIMDTSRGIYFSDFASAKNVIVTLTGNNGHLLSGIEDAWLTDEASYEAPITNYKIIPQAMQYARQNSPFFKYKKKINYNKSLHDYFSFH